MGKRKRTVVLNEKRKHRLGQLETVAKKLTGSKFTISGGHKGTKGHHSEMARDIARELGKATKARKRNVKNKKGAKK